jgi:hypothetical protein
MLPSELARPHRQLLLPLWAHDFASANILNSIGVSGMASLIPLFVLGLALPVVAILRSRERWLSVAAALWSVLLCGWFVAVMTLMPTHMSRRAVSDLRSHLELIKDSWNPSGHDRAAPLEQELAKNPNDEALRLELIAFYRREYRSKRAKKLESWWSTQVCKRTER